MITPSASIELSEIILFIQPYAVAVLSMILSIATPIIASRIYQVFGVKFTDSQWAVAHSAALAAAGKFWAAADVTISKAKINVGSPGIASAAQGAIDVIPAVARTIGLTPEAMASLIVSKIGLLQSSAGAVEGTSADRQE